MCAVGGESPRCVRHSSYVQADSAFAFGVVTGKPYAAWSTRGNEGLPRLAEVRRWLSCACASHAHTSRGRPPRHRPWSAGGTLAERLGWLVMVWHWRVRSRSRLGSNDVGLCVTERCGGFVSRPSLEKFCLGEGLRSQRHQQIATLRLRDSASWLKCYFVATELY